MAYNKTVWVDDETPLSAEHMNNIENGIEKSVEKPETSPTDDKNYFLQKSDNKTGTVWTPIDYEVDQAFNPDSQHAQSGVAINNFVSENTVGKKVKTIVGETVKVGEIFNDYNNNIASGNLSHAEGGMNSATGNYSHSEGVYTTSSASISHSEGYTTSATGNYSHAEGYANVTSSYASGVHNDGNGYYPEWNDQITYTKNSIVYHKDKMNDGVERNRLYIAIKTVDIGTDIGDTTSWSLLGAVGVASHVEGDKCGAIGRASHAEGNRCVAFGDESHSEGNCSSAFGSHSHVEGANDRSVLYNENTVYPKFSTVSLKGSRSYPTYIAIKDVPADATGGNAPPNEEYWRIVGAYSYGAHCEGGRNYIGAIRNTDGSYKQDSSNSSHAEGLDNIILPTESSNAQASHIEGSKNYVSSSYAHAEGYNNVVSGQSAHVGGSYNIATKHNQTVIGTCNENKEDTLFEVGSGRVTESTNDSGVTTTDVTRKNAFEVTKDGKIRLPNHTSNSSSTTDGYMSFKCVNGNLVNENGSGVSSPIIDGSGVTSALQNTGGSSGENITADGKYGIAFNRKTHADGEASLAANYHTHANKWGAAFNNGSSALGESSFSTGINTVANGGASFVGGTASTANGSNDVAFGNQGKTNQDSIEISAPTSDGSSSGGSTPSSNTTTLSSINKLASFAMGNVVYSNGPGAVVLGQQSVAVGDDAVSIGYRTVSGIDSKKVNNEWVEIDPKTGVSILPNDEIKYGTSTFASGYMTHASGPASATFNALTRASHMNSSAFGFHSATTRPNQLICGQYNPLTADGIFVVGGGRDESHRRVALSVHPDLSEDSNNPQLRLGDTYISSSELSTIKGMNPTPQLIEDITLDPDVVEYYLQGTDYQRYSTIIVTTITSTGKHTHMFNPSISQNEEIFVADRTTNSIGYVNIEQKFGTNVVVSVSENLRSKLLSIQIYGKKT